MFEDRRGESGPFDIIGDVHGCADELIELLQLLGHAARLEGGGVGRRAVTRVARGRRVVFVGDLVDRGPASPDVVRIAMAMVATGQAWCVPGNHDNKFMRWLQGRPVKIVHGLEATVAQMQAEPPEFHTAARVFIESLVNYIWLDSGNLIVTHAGLEARMIGESGDHVRRFCLFGDTDNKLDEHGLTIRYHWAAGYRGEPAIVYGHTPVAQALWFNNTLCIDTGAVFGGSLTALRWPEREIVSVSARAEYAVSKKPFGHPPHRPAR